MMNKENRLTPFEEYMYWDDTPAFPMYCLQILKFSGDLNRELFQESFYEALERHPLYNARVVFQGKKPYWELLSEPPEIQFVRDKNPGFLHPSYPDINSGSGISLLVHEKLDDQDRISESEVSFFFHHSVSDGLGMASFFEDLMISYAIRSGRILPTTSYLPLSENSMTLRQEPGFTWKRYFKIFFRGMKTTRTLLAHLPEPLLPLKRADRKTPPNHFYPYTSLTFSAEDSNAYYRRAKSLGVTLNDLLIRDMFLAIADFKKCYAPGNRWIRVAIPINMRPVNFPHLFAANVVSMIFIDRRPSQISTSDSFLEGIHQEMEWVKRTDQGLSLLENLKGRRNMPGGIQMEMRGNRCWSTTVLSNLGRLFAKTPLPRTEDGRLIVGNAVLEEITGMPPLRAKTMSGWAVSTYAGRMTFSSQFDDRYLNSEQIKDRSLFFKKRIEESIQKERVTEKSVPTPVLLPQLSQNFVTQTESIPLAVH